MSREKECKCCHEWWYASVIKEDLCPNCYDYFKQLKQQLDEYKNKENTSAVNSWDELLKNCENCSLKECIGCEYTQTCVQNIKQQLAEKDKEIEMLKHTLNLYNLRHKGSVLPNVKQLAIQELEKVKTLIQNAISFEKPNFVGVYDTINNQIKELKGENDTFKCEICGEITPKNCEGGEPNVCADCVPTKTHDLSTKIEPQSHENDFLD